MSLRFDRADWPLWTLGAGLFAIGLATGLYFSPSPPPAKSARAAETSSRFTESTSSFGVTPAAQAASSQTFRGASDADEKATPGSGNFSHGLRLALKESDFMKRGMIIYEMAQRLDPAG